MNLASTVLEHHEPCMTEGGEVATPLPKLISVVADRNDHSTLRYTLDLDGTFRLLDLAWRLAGESTDTPSWIEANQKFLVARHALDLLTGRVT
jgi:hypothetical protein